MDTIAPVVATLLILVALAATATRIKQHRALTDTPWYVIAGAIVVGSFISAAVRHLWPLEGWWGLPRSVGIISVMLALAIGVLPRRKA